jgi:uncharacterized nucleotidyltransferase DUF6036
MPSATPPDLPNPWRAFLLDVDARLTRPIEVHCLGGFATALYTTLLRTTNDIDYIEVVPNEAQPTLQQIAGAGSAMAKKHRLHFQHVTVASLPESYADRLAERVSEAFRHLRLFALDPHDLALSKLARNSPIDRADVARLAKAVPLDAAVLRTRYQNELRPIIIGDPERHDQTLEMWIEAYLWG